MKITKTCYVLGVLLVAGVVSAATISATNKWSWGGTVGWMNWNPTNGSVVVTDSQITGHVWSQRYGWINLQPINGGVTNTCSGDVGGYAWGAGVGYINMNGVSINPSTGVFSGTATTTSHGDIAFTGTNVGVITSWRCTTSSGGGGSSSDIEDLASVVTEEEVVIAGVIDGRDDWQLYVVVSDSETDTSPRCTDIDEDGYVQYDIPGIYDDDEDFSVEIESSVFDPGTYYYRVCGRYDNGESSLRDSRVRSFEITQAVAQSETEEGDSEENSEEEGVFVNDESNKEEDSQDIEKDEAENANGATCPVFTQYMRLGDQDGQPALSSQSAGVSTTMREVALLQKTLADQGLYSGPLSGYFGQQTREAVNLWQELHRDQVLAPWGLAGPTGWFYKSSERWMNELLGCSDSVILDNGIYLEGRYVAQEEALTDPGTANIQELLTKMIEILTAQVLEALGQ